jgi:hypothetical protein
VLVIDFYYQIISIEFLPEWKGIQDHTLHIILNIHIEQVWIDRRTLVNSILQVEALTSTTEVQCLLNALYNKLYQKIGKDIFLLQDLVEAVVIDRFMERFFFINTQHSF